jgi:sialate O-acetylesterase
MIGSFILGLVLARQGSAPFLSPVFGDHMVLQRDRPNSFWGWSTPGALVKVDIAGHTAQATTDPSGKWSVRVSPPPTGGPYTVIFDGPQHLELHDVLVGDVWICSGQSNMEMGIGIAANGPDEIAAANYPNIRLAMLDKGTSYVPKALATLPWTPCTPTSVAANGWGGFSAAAYYFGRELNKRLNIPIGLVETCWGGTEAEAWVSRKGLVPLKDFDGGLKAIDDIKSQNKPSYDQQISNWLVKNDPGTKAGSGFETPDFDDSSWQVSPTVAANFDTIGLSQFDGVVWFRKEFTLPAQLPTGPVTISLGSIDDEDATWVNGVQVGHMNHYNDVRQYVVPASALKPGRNVVVVRCLDTGGGGGFISDASMIYLQLGDGTKQPLEGGWKYKASADLKTSTPLPVSLDEGNPNVPTVLYNAMIAPLQPLAIKGAIWYQGEANADRAYQYRSLLPALISDWRREWGEGNFPFFVVQLANFMPYSADPMESAWAELREAQTMTVEKVKNSGLAVAIDIGNPNDIHPKDKQDVGLRLALSALHVAYGQKVAFSGPTFKSLKKEGSTLRVNFDNAQGGLKVKGALKGFEVAGSDHKFHWADATVDGTSVVLKSSDVLDPIAVRYGWANTPDAPLYNAEDLPAVPFRTDSWKGVTEGKK